MKRATWYLGPLGGLRELPVPNPGFDDTVTRYGGVHQGLSGARTVDVTGYRSSFTFSWNNLLPDEFNYFRALHSRLIPGPYRLIDPRYKNRLSTQSSTMEVRPHKGAARVRGLGISLGGVVNYQWASDWPSEAGPGARCVRFSGYETGGSALAYARFDNGVFAPVFDSETLTFSVYAKSEAASSHCTLAIDLYDKELGRLDGGPSEVFELTDSWQRISLSTDVPPGCAAVSPIILFGRWNSPGDVAEPLLFAAPQLEEGVAATGWELGGGAKTVAIESLSSSSPQFLYEDCTLTLVET